MKIKWDHYISDEEILARADMQDRAKSIAAAYTGEAITPECIMIGPQRSCC